MKQRLTIGDIAPIASMKRLRKMEPGDTAVFRFSDASNPQAMVTAITSKIGGKFRIVTLIVVDPKTPEAQKCLFVRCLKKANPKKLAGRKRNVERKDNEMQDQT